MNYELHLTVTPVDLRAWTRVCKELGLRPIYIGLAEGVNKDQLMCEAEFSTHPFKINGLAKTLIERIEEAGFKVVRNKLECPLNFAQGIENPAYYECHMKMLLDSHQIKKVPRISKLANVYVSKSKIPRTDRLEKWYMTTRQYGGTIEEAKNKFMLAYNKVKRHLPVFQLELECAIYDSNPRIDEGWVPEASSPPASALL